MSHKPWRPASITRGGSQRECKIKTRLKKNRGFQNGSERKMEIKSAGTWIISKISIWRNTCSANLKPWKVYLPQIIPWWLLAECAHSSVLKSSWCLKAKASPGSKTQPQTGSVFVWLNGSSPVFFSLILDLVKHSGRCDWERWELCNCVLPTRKSYIHVQIRSTATCSKVCRTEAAKCTPAFMPSQN